MEYFTFCTNLLFTRLGVDVEVFGGVGCCQYTIWSDIITWKKVREKSKCRGTCWLWDCRYRSEILFSFLEKCNVGRWRLHREHIHLGFPATSRPEVAGGRLDRKWSTIPSRQEMVWIPSRPEVVLALYQRESSIAYFFHLAVYLDLDLFIYICHCIPVAM